MGNTTTRRDITDQWGDVANREYQAAPDSTIRDLDKYLAALPTLTADDFVMKTANAILGAAILSGHRFNSNADECKVSASYHESNRRHLAAGHSDECHNGTLYKRAHAEAMRSQGHTPTPEQPCTCGNPNAAA